MKRISLLLLTTLFSMSLFSCANDSIADTESLFDVQSTEGDDGDTDEDPDDN